MSLVPSLSTHFINSIKQNDETFQEDISNLAGLILHSMKCQSPVERILFWAMCDRMLLEVPGDIGLHGSPGPYIPIDTHNWEDADVIGVDTQFREPPYVIDFVLTCWSLRKKESVLFAVEVDGHDFHEKTKEQAQKDRSRERFLISKGYIVLRFTGSEVFKDPYGVVDEIISQVIAWGKNG